MREIQLTSSAVDPVEYASLMKAHLTRIFGERDPARRMMALTELCSENATFLEPHATATGYEAISRAVDALLASMPPDFRFSALSTPLGHHGVACLRWRLGPPDGPAAATGTDVAQIENGRIGVLHVFLDPIPSA